MTALHKFFSNVKQICTILKKLHCNVMRRIIVPNRENQQLISAILSQFLGDAVKNIPPTELHTKNFVI